MAFQSVGIAGFFLGPRRTVFVNQGLPDVPIFGPGAAAVVHLHIAAVDELSIFTAECEL